MSHVLKPMAQMRFATARNPVRAATVISERDRAVYGAYCAGTAAADLAKQYDVSNSTIQKAIARVRDHEREQRWMGRTG